MKGLWLIARCICLLLVLTRGASRATKAVVIII